MSSRPALPQSNSVQNLSKIEQSVQKLLWLEYLTLWSWTCSTCFEIVCTKFKLSHDIHSWNVTISDANTSWHAMTLSVDSLTLKVCYRSGVTWSQSAANLIEIEQSPTELFIIWQIFASVTFPCDLDLSLLDLELLWYFRYHVFKPCTKFERNGTIRGRVIDDLAHFCRQIFIGVPNPNPSIFFSVCLPSTSQKGSFSPVFSWHCPLITLRRCGLCNSFCYFSHAKKFWWHWHWQIHEWFWGVCGPNFTKLGEDTGPSSLLTKFVSDFRHLDALSNAGRLKISGVENEAKFCTFWPPCKKEEGVTGSLTVASPTTKPRGIHFTSVLCAAVESCVTGKK